MNVLDDIVHGQDEKKLANYINLFSDALTVSEKARLLSRQSRFPDKPGVYCLFEDDKVVYVGETGSLQERMKDIFRTMNHSFRRSLGKDKFRDIKGVDEAGSKKNFPIEVEIQLTNYMESKIKVAFAPVIIGRKEIEESIVAKHKPIYNSRGQRGQ